MYHIIIGHITGTLGHDEKGVILQVVDSSKLFQSKSSVDKVKWNKENIYSYELTVPPIKADSLNYYILSDLNRYSDFIGGVEKRRVKCLVLVRNSAEDKLKTKGGKAINTLSDKEKHQLVNRAINQLTG